MHMEEVIYDLKRSIDRMRNIHPIKQDSIVPNNPLGIPNELAVKTGLDRAALTPNAIRDILGAVTNKITQSIDKEMMEDITPPKRTMKDVKVGDKVRYVTPMPEGTWMGEAWGDRDRLKVDPKRTSTEYISPLSSIEQMFADSAKQMAQDINKAVTYEVIAMMDDKQLNDDEFMAMKLNASMSRDELIELIHKLRAKINEMTPLRPINTYGPDFKPAPPKRTMKELEGETPIQGI